ncbi:hypothetical protein CBA19CS22_17890 [Caballeronia novacaledonica]|uniref:Uncharacterized protein n=1 Tax=Caballeronia novacaledonica TaxID=1544861 RepID=A0ACB5QUS0_9BURK|nr:hypothetical protein CBA19CS22_17890 [Caballeronia novacaledonica]
MKLTPEKVIELAKMIGLEADPKKLQAFAMVIEDYTRDELTHYYKGELNLARTQLRAALVSLNDDTQHMSAQLKHLIEH